MTVAESIQLPPVFRGWFGDGVDAVRMTLAESALRLAAHLDDDPATDPGGDDVLRCRSPRVRPGEMIGSPPWERATLFGQWPGDETEGLS